MSTRKQAFERDGYVMEQVLSEAEVQSFRDLMAALLDPKKGHASLETANSAMQHLGDPLNSFGTQAKQYYIHMLGTPGAQPILHAYHIPKVLEIVADLLGPDPIVNNASIFATNPGVTYSLPWHRDIIQVPVENIRDELFSPDWPHNSVQINLPLYEENCLWVVPRSHNRPNTPGEIQAFAGSKHYAPVGAEMPGGEPVKIPAGFALFYNNNLIHRGYNDRMDLPRRTLHMGYHSASRKPTWHFYLLPLEPIRDPAYQATLKPQIRRMVEEYLACRERFTYMEDTWQPGWPGPVENVNVYS